MKYCREHLIEKLIQHEGLKLQVYQDTLGIDTIGIGRNLQDRGISDGELEDMDIPNIEYVYKNGITEVDAMILAENDIIIVEDELVRAHSCVEDLDSVRQLVLVDMAFNMGVPRLCKFKKMWAAIHESDFDNASAEMLDSLWATQVGNRARKLAEAMKTGEFL
tara:strand:+ start:85 stop:573 length:489 start_codon:yes stop_codon:yes gene_type:complete